MGEGEKFAEKKEREVTGSPRISLTTKEDIERPFTFELRLGEEEKKECRFFDCPPSLNRGREEKRKREEEEPLQDFGPGKDFGQ